MKARRRRVALAFPMAHAHLAQVTAGIKDYAHQHGDWALAIAPETLGMSLRSLRGWPSRTRTSRRRCVSSGSTPASRSR